VVKGIHGGVLLTLKTLVLGEGIHWGWRLQKKGAGNRPVALYKKRKNLLF
jgi:hypothetical protein